MNYQWYPGHMTKAKRMMEENLALIDLIIEVVDARAPIASRNPDIDVLGKNKFRIVILNKADLADKKVTDAYKTYFEGKDIAVLELDARAQKGVKEVKKLVLEVCAEKIERDRKRGIKNRPVRAMVVGIPNVGKSTFINSLAGRASAKTGNKPGVTKGKQWITVDKGLELLDTPGILWPKFEDPTVGEKLAMLGSINDEVINLDELALKLFEYLKALSYAEAVYTRYGIKEEHDGVKAIENIAIKRNYYKNGQETDYSKAAFAFLDDFRSGRIGRITLERPVG